MSKQKVTLLNKLEKGQPHPRLDQFLAERLPEALNCPISKSSVRKLIVAGAVYINSKRVRIASKPIFDGTKVDVHVDLDRLSDVKKEAESKFDITPDMILYRDQDLIVLNKPSGITTQPTIDKARNTLYTALLRFLRTSSGPEAYAGLHHRLDRDTSGAILFTLDPRANRSISEAFKNHSIQKTYIAQVESPQRLPQEDHFIVKNFLKRDPRSDRNLAKYMSTLRGGDAAETHFKILDRAMGLIECRPITGRTHQIRVHLSELGTPILGDSIYGRAKNASRLMLHAHRLELQHPTETEKKLSIEAPLPKEFTQAQHQSDS